MATHSNRQRLSTTSLAHKSACSRLMLIKVLVCHAPSVYTTNSISDAVCQSHFSDMVAAKIAIIITMKVCQLLAVLNRSTLTVMQTPTCHPLTTARVQDRNHHEQTEHCSHHQLQEVAFKILKATNLKATMTGSL